MQFQLIKSLVINIETAQFTRVAEWWNYTRLSSSFTRLYYVTDGDAYVVQDGKKYPLKRGTLTLIPENTLCDYRCRTFMDQYYLHFTAHVFGVMNLFEHVPIVKQVSCSKDTGVEQMMKRAVECFQAPTGSSLLELDGLVRQMISILIKAAEGKWSETDYDQVARFRPVIDFIEKDPSRAIKLEELASLVHLQPTYFSNHFCSVFGIPPLQYVKKRRIELAKIYLWKSAESMKTIASRLGFADVYHFSKVFKQTVGIPPNEFRKQRLLPVNSIS